MQQALRDFFNNSTQAGRCLISIALSWPFFLWLWSQYGALHYSGAALRGAQPEVLRYLTHGIEAALVINALVFVWMWPRRHSPAPQLAGQLVASMTITVLYTALQIAQGTFTTSMSMITVGLLAIGLLLSDKRVVLTGFVFVIVALTVADGLILSGHLPYAVLFTPELFAQGEIAVWWLNLRNGLFYYLNLMPWLGIIFWLLHGMDRQSEELELLSRTDGLTGLANRRHFMERLEVETQRRLRYGRAFCVVLCDADHFKRVNDTYGHHAGDEVLRHFGRVLQESLRVPADLAARLGGEEFALLLPETTQAQAEIVCARIGSALRGHEFDIDGHRFRVTISMGAVESLHLTGEEALKQADINLYAAKTGGRDRFVSTADSAEGAVDLMEATA
jgi:diguanylate cyclase (GGDEF)-like protein